MAFFSQNGATGTTPPHEKHTRLVMELAGKYMSEHSESAAKQLSGLYPQTLVYYGQFSSTDPSFHGVVAIHAHMLALWNINEHFRPNEAQTYALVAQECYKKAIDASPELPKETLLYLEQVQLICAYIDYYNDNFQGALNWLKDVDIANTTATVLALAATALFRLSAEEGANAFQTAYDLFGRMDRQFRATPHFSFEEDILRAGYGFYEMYFTHPRENDNGDPFPFAPHDPAKALEILTRACSLLTVEAQIGYMREDIESVEKKLMEDRIKTATEQEDTADADWVEVDDEGAADDAVQAFFMEVYDAFHIMGQGMIASGCIHSGSVKVGDSVTIVQKKSGECLTAVVRSISRGIETDAGFSSVSVDQAKSGDLVNILLPDLPKKSIRVGDSILN